MRTIDPSGKPLRIAMLCLHSSPLGPLGTKNTGGMSVYVREIAGWMARAGHSVDIFTLADGLPETTNLFPAVRLIALNPRRQRRIPKERMFDHLPQAVVALERFARLHDLTYDVIHSHYWLSGTAGVEIQKSWGCPHIITFHTLGLVKNHSTAGESEPDHRIHQERQLVQASHAMVVPSEGERRHLLDSYGASPQRVHTIPCGVNMERFKPVGKENARGQLNMDPARPLILFVGRFAPVKGMDVLFEAVAQLAPRHDSFRLVVVGGDGPQAAATKTMVKLAEKLDISDLILMAGRVDHDQLPVYYSAADLTVLPSTYESFGLVVLESLACGTPVAATRVGGAATIIEEGKNGTIITEPRSRSVAQGIERLMALVRQQTFTAQGIRDSISRYGWDRAAGSLISLYGKLANGEEM